MPRGVIWPRLRAREPSVPSVIEAAMNSAEASNSFSPCALPNRLVDRIQISSGMQRIRANVMELGKFTGGHRALSAGSHKTSVSSIILHGASGKQWPEGKTSEL